jgi:hypothetical protein
LLGTKGYVVVVVVVVVLCEIFYRQLMPGDKIKKIKNEIVELICSTSCLW